METYRLLLKSHAFATRSREQVLLIPLERRWEARYKSSHAAFKLL